MLLERTPSFAPGLGLAVVAVAAVVLPVIALRPHLGRGRVQLAAAVLGLGVLLAGPAAYAADTMATAYAGGDPSAGPQAASTDRGPGGAGSPNVNSGPLANGRPGHPPAGIEDGTRGITPGFVQGAPRGIAGGPDGIAGGPGGAGLGSSVTDYLVANQGSATWIVAVSGGTSAGQVEIETGKAVMAIGGFNGSDDAPTLEQLQSLISGGQLRFVATGGGGAAPGGGAPGGGVSSSSISSWVTSACTAVTIHGSTTSVYDCAGAISG